MILTVAVIVLVALAILFLTGPRVSSDTTITFDPSVIGDDPEAWLAARETQTPDLRDDTAKEIIRADPASRERTPLAIVYVHGFSASKGEIRPVPDRVAAELGANLFYTRLAGHGQDGAAMAGATVRDWVNDYAEAMAIGRMLGEKVIVMATSTGGTLATWAAAQPALSEDVAGMVLVSPNYGPQERGTWALTLPWGGWLAKTFAGPERGFTPANELHGRYWTTRYPIAATLPMAALVKLARATPVETVSIPALFLFSDADKVVRPELTRAVAGRWGAPHETMMVEGADDPDSHVIAGDAVSPSTTTLAAERMIEWIRSLPQ